MKQKLLNSFKLRAVMLVAILCAGFTSAWGDEVTDVITASDLTATGTTYTDFSNVSKTSKAVYAGNSAKDNSGNIQMRSKNSNSGIVSTTSGGTVKSVKITVGSGSNTVDVYGSNTAYAAASDLYNANKQGTKIGSVTATGTITFSGDYEYVGIRSNNGAIYLSSIEIVWETSGSGSSAVATTTSIDASGITNTDVYTGTAAGTLSATVTAGENAVAGATVTWSGNNDNVATIDEETGEVTLVAAGSVTFTATYAGVTDTYQPSSATYEMTVTNSTPYVQPTTVEITPNYTFWGKNAQFSGDTYSDLSGSKDNVTLEWSKGNGSTYANQNAMRFYKDNTLTFTAPTGYEIKSIVLTVTGTYSDLSFSPTGYNSTNTTWTGTSQTVTMSRPSNGSSYATISKFTITIGLPSTDPSITVAETSVNVSATDEEGTIGITYANLTITNMADFDIQFCDAQGGALASGSEPEWIMVEVASQDPQIGEGYVVSYIMDPNTATTPRSAYFKIYVGQTYSDLITVTQAGAVETLSYTLATSITSGKHYIITNGSDKAMGEQHDNNRAAVDVEITNNTASFASNAGVAEFVIYGPDADGYYTIYDGTGYLYAASGSKNYLKTEATLDDNGRWEISINNASIVAKGTNTNNVMHYNANNGNPMFSCYASNSSVTAPVYLYEKDGEATPTESKTLNSFGYATYASQNALDFTNNSEVSAWAITAVNSESGVITFSQITGQAPAGTGMLLKGTASGSVTMTSATGASALTGNLLEGITTATDVTAGEYFGLKGNEFVPVNAGTVPAGKALLPASEVPAEIKAFTFVFETVDGIKTVEHVSAEEAAEIFNLAGQRLKKAQRGVNIINGKKVLVK